ncbi:MAG: SIMPL domain-containing protein [Anaerolineae bacterium]
MMGKRTNWSRIVIGVSLALMLVLAVGCGSVSGTGTNTGSNSAAGTSLGVINNNNDAVPHISVNGSGRAYGTPDVAYIVLGVNTVDTDASKAVAANSAAMNAVIEAVKAAGVDQKDIQTTVYNMYVEQVVDKDGIPTGQSRLHIDNEIQITLRQPQNAGSLITDALQAGANTVSNISFAVLDTAALEQQARDAAITQAKARAEQLAAGFGAKLGAVRVVNEYTSSPAPVSKDMAPLGMGAASASAVNVQAGQFVVTVDIQVEFTLQ